MNKKRLAADLILNILGSTLLAFGVYAFIMPFDLIVGGVTGISLIIHRLTAIRVSLVSLILNLLVLIPAWILGGKKLAMGSVLSSLVYPAAMAVFENFPVLTEMADTRLLAVICGAAACGAGVGAVMRSGGSTGGLDIPVLLLSRRLNLPANDVLRVFDVCIMLGQIPLFGLTGILYGFVYTWLMTAVLGSVLAFGEERLRVTVQSENYEELRRNLVASDFGVTMVSAEGGYTKTPIKQVESVMPAGRLRQARRVIEETDAAAFVTVEKVKEVRGQGFTRAREPIFMGSDDLEQEN